MKHILTFESIRNQYSEMGAAHIGIDAYYATKKQDYKNPHLSNIEHCLQEIIDKINIGSFLDLGCGNGEVSTFLSKVGFEDFRACDPHFDEIYKNNTGHECDKLSFQDISKNGLDMKFDTIICSYALHLCPASYMNNLLYNLSISCKHLIVISPSKYPIVPNDYFEMIEYFRYKGTHCRIFKSNM